MFETKGNSYRHLSLIAMPLLNHSPSSVYTERLCSEAKINDNPMRSSQQQATLWRFSRKVANFYVRENKSS